MEVWFDKEDLSPSGLLKMVEFYREVGGITAPAHDLIISWPSPVFIAVLDLDDPGFFVEVDGVKVKPTKEKR